MRTSLRSYARTHGTPSYGYWLDAFARALNRPPGIRLPSGRWVVEPQALDEWLAKQDATREVDLGRIVDSIAAELEAAE